MMEGRKDPKKEFRRQGQKNKNARTSRRRILTGFPLDFLKVAA